MSLSAEQKWEARAMVAEAALRRAREERDRYGFALTKIAYERWGPGAECIWCMGPTGAHRDHCPTAIAFEALWP